MNREHRHSLSVSAEELRDREAYTKVFETALTVALSNADGECDRTAGPFRGPGMRGELHRIAQTLINKHLGPQR